MPTLTNTSAARHKHHDKQCANPPVQAWTPSSTASVIDSMPSFLSRANPRRHGTASDFLDELRELRSAPTTLSRLSETADIFFSISRAQYDGFPVPTLPPFSLARHGAPMAYMVAKYPLRWGFYRTAVRLSGAKEWKRVREVINPAKDHKLGEVSARHGINPDKFRDKGRMLRRVWPLLP